MSMNWFERMKSGFLTRIKRELPEGLWVKCTQCGHSTYQQTMERNHGICPQCRHHASLGHEHYVDMLIDAGTFVEIDSRIGSVDPLKFKDTRRYSDKLKEGRRRSRMNESIYTGLGCLGGHPVALGVMDTRFILGSLGGATGEKIARLIDRAIAERRTLIIICQSGGARMQEGTYSLMQMAKISAKLHQLAGAGLLYISILTDPTYGGVTASFAMLGDLILAEPGARIGFAGQAVIKQFLEVDELPQDFQIAEAVLEHGFIDRIVPRDELASTLSKLIALFVPAEEAAPGG